MSAGHIVAMGGGGFLMEPGNPLLDDFVLSLVPRRPAKVCFLPTASGDSALNLVKFYRAFSTRALATDVTVFDPPSLPRQPARTADIPDVLAGQDVIYVGGGSTVNLLAIWRAQGIDRALRAAWEGGAILCGVSAGMLCWFRDGLTDSFGGLLPVGDGLGFIDASASPHYDAATGRRAAYHEAIENGLPPGYAADDGAALHFRGTEFVEAVASRENARAYFVERVNGGVRETRLPVRYLGRGAGA
ncbi:MAG TPA: peptidase E [Gammaproteobacteria bacterium]|nr:peptidase E [Gammaproteobacteria bacterium]